MKPIHSFLFLLLIGGLCYAVSFVFPSEGVAMTDEITLIFPQFSALWHKGDDEVQEPEFEDVEELLEMYEVEIDSLAIRDSLQRREAQRRQELLKIQYADDDKSGLFAWFEKLQQLRNGGKLRVMHYGDSQIEGDRISSYIRNELQKEFGGHGPGLLQAYEVIPTMAIKQSSSDNWYRKALYGRRDTAIKHKDYGLLAHFSAYHVDSLNSDSLPDAWLKFSPSKIAYYRTKIFSKAILFYGNNDSRFGLNTYVNDSLVSSETIPPTSFDGIKTVNFSSTPESVKFEFWGDAGPDIYGVSFEGNSGIILDNIPLRGSSGTIFKRINKSQLAAQYQDLDIGLFILQFGGNTVPYIQNKEGAEKYGRWFKSQIQYLKNLVPSASVIVIGPSDMAYKVEDRFVSRPFLEDVRDALKKASFETHSGFWDIYEVMGGQNSMNTWVEAEPALAGKDYTHFTPKGAKKIAELFCKTIWEEYTSWKTLQK